MRIHLRLLRAAALAALLPLAAGCMSAGKRYEQGQRLEARGQSAEAARRYIDALRRDASLADARARLEETGAAAVQQFLAQADAEAASGAHVDAAESLLRLDAFRREVASVGVNLAVPDGYAEHRRSVLDRAIEDAVDQGARMAQSGRFGDALARLDWVARFQPAPEQRRRADEARLETYAQWMAREAAAGRHRAAYGVGERAVSAMGRQFPGMERIIEAQQFALDEGTVRVAVLPVLLSREAERQLPASFLRDVENELEAGAWTRPPAFLEMVDPRAVRREARRYDLDELGYTSEAARLGRDVGADMVVMVEIDTVGVSEPDPRRERRAVRTRSGADTAFVVRSGRRDAYARVRYVVISVPDQRILARDQVVPQVSRSFREGEYAGDWRQLLLNDEDRRLFDPSRRDDARGDLMRDLSRELTDELPSAVYSRVLNYVQ